MDCSQMTDKQVTEHARHHLQQIADALRELEKRDVEFEVQWRDGVLRAQQVREL